MADRNSLYQYTLRIADDQLILGQRLGEWCGHAPMLEEDLALANIALDFLGQARALYSYAGEVENAGRDEDQLAFLRYERDYVNALLVEQPNGDFAHTIARQLYFSAFMESFWREMSSSRDATLAAIAAKAFKEVAYHLRHAAEWTIRLGDGTEESRERMIEGLDALMPYTGELFEVDGLVAELVDAKIGVDAAALQQEWEGRIALILGEAGLKTPEAHWMQSGGRLGKHTEHLGHLLSDLQYMQRAYPDMRW